MSADVCKHGIPQAWCDACTHPVQRGEGEGEGGHVDIAALKEKIDIETVLLACGAQIREGWGFKGEKEVFCPFHVNHNTPAGAVNVLKGVYHCYACGVGGDIISLAKAHLMTDDFHEAVRWLEVNFA